MMKDRRMNLALADTKGLTIVVNSYELRRDIHVFIEYLKSRDVKRLTRSNDLPKPDVKRLAKIMLDPEERKDVQITGSSHWIDFIDDLVLKLGFVSYDTNGEYAGYTSSEPSFFNNYIKFKGEAYSRFLELTPTGQEEFILHALRNDYGNSNNEFFNTPILGVLDRFQTWGCALGVVPTIRFDQARGYLLNILKNCESGVWYSTGSFIQYMKKEHPYFLIPENIKIARNRGDGGRYQNFIESANYFSKTEPIPDNASDAFERVEGRYIERFLEGIPLTMRYVDVAYKLSGRLGMSQDGNQINIHRKKGDGTIYPSINMLKAFRVNERFLRFMNGTTRKPIVTVQPNFEIHVESDLYPTTIMSKLRKLTKVIADDTSIILKLDKQNVTSQLVENEELDVIELLKELSNKELPLNVTIELKEWSDHSEMFVLYEGFGLLECDKKPKLANDFIEQSISPRIKIIRYPGKFFFELEKKEYAPIKIIHYDDYLEPPARGVESIFLKRSPTVKKEKKAVTLSRKYLTTLFFPSRKSFQRITEELDVADFIFEKNDINLSITYGKHLEPVLMNVFKTMKDEYDISFHDRE